MRSLEVEVAIARFIAKLRQVLFLDALIVANYFVFDRLGSSGQWNFGAQIEVIGFGGTALLVNYCSRPHVFEDEVGFKQLFGIKLHFLLQDDVYKGHVWRVVLLFGLEAYLRA